MPRQSQVEVEDGDKSTQIYAQHGQLIEDFGTLYFGAAKALLQAGKLLCKLVDSLPDAYSTLIGRYPALSRSSLKRLEAIGRERLLPELALDASPAVGYISKMPLEQQKQLTQGALKVVTPNGHVETKLYKHLSFRECKQIFANNKIQYPTK